MGKREKRTAEEIQECRRLREAWSEYQRAHPGTPQSWLAEQLDMTQGGLSHYLNGRNRLNLPLLLRVSGLLGVSPASISQKLASTLESLPAPAAAEPGASYAALTAEERDLIDYIRTRGGTDAHRASIARQLRLVARAFLEQPVDNERLERAGFRAPTRKKN